MSASDYIYEKVPGPRPTDEEVAAVLDWCREWAEDSFDEEIPFDDVQLLRGCETHVDGGLAFVLADVRRIAEHDAGMETLAARFAEQDAAGEHHDIRKQSCRDCGRDFPYSEDVDYCPDCVRENLGEPPYSDAVAAVVSEQAARLRELFALLVRASPFYSETAEGWRGEIAYRNGLMDAYVLLSGHDAEHVYEIAQNVLQARAEGAVEYDPDLPYDAEVQARKRERRDLHERALAVACYDCGADAGRECRPEYGCDDASRAAGHRVD